MKKHEIMEPSKGEVSGAFFLGYIESFKNLNALPKSGLNLPIIQPQKWYPYADFIATTKVIEKLHPSDILLFQAGINFLKIWYEHGAGKEMIFSALDWLNANTKSGGYNSVVRGGRRDEIGWCDLQYLNIKKGIAIYHDVSPIHGDFLRGVFYGGCTLFNDVEYVEIICEEESYPNNLAFISSVITVNFRLKPVDTALELEKKIDLLKIGENLNLGTEEIESLIWRYKGLNYQHAISEEYNKQVVAMLAKSINIIQEISIKDGLTDIFNRRHFKTIFPQLINSAKRTNGYICLFILDIDCFKQYNDTYGHPAGDRALINVATILNQLVQRADDYCFRVGGEEFAVVFQNQNRQKVEALKIEHKHNTASLYLTVSIGVLCKPAKELGCNEVIYKEADDLLYQAKKNGRNRVVTNSDAQ